MSFYLTRFLKISETLDRPNEARRAAEASYLFWISLYCN